jgi:hypothetical protein
MTLPTIPDYVDFLDKVTFEDIEKAKTSAHRSAQFFKSIGHDPEEVARSLKWDLENAHRIAAASLALRSIWPK